MHVDTPAVTEQISDERLAEMLAALNSAPAGPIRALLTELQQRREAEAGTPEGWKLVPRRPTDDMMNAGNYQSSHDSTSADVYSAWVDMWDAAPSPEEYDSPSKVEHKGLAAAPSSPATGVKPLVWQMENVDGTFWTGWGHVGGNEYRVQFDGTQWLTVQGMVILARSPDRASAQTAGDAAYEARIRSALEER